MGPCTANARRPTVVSQCRGTSISCCVADLRRCLHADNISDRCATVHEVLRSLAMPKYIQALTIIGGRCLPGRQMSGHSHGNLQFSRLLPLVGPMYTRRRLALTAGLPREIVDIEFRLRSVAPLSQLAQ